MSVTSSAEDNTNSDTEYFLVKLLAERLCDGKPLYLVEWEGYPLAMASWEPLEHLNQDTLSDWETFKRETGRRTALNFEVSDWKQAIVDYVEGKRARHEARNLRRKQPKIFKKCRQQEYLEIAEESLEDFEEPDDTAIVVAQSPTGGNPSDSTDTSKIGDARDSSALSDANMQQPNANAAPEPTGLSPLNPAHAVQRQQFGQPSPITVGANSRRLDPNTNGAATGENVFVGGKRIKNRPTLLDAVSDVKKRPKMLKHRFRRIVEKRRRDRDGVVAPACPSTELMENPSDMGSSVRPSCASDTRQDAVAAPGDALGDHNTSPEAGFTAHPSEQPPSSDGVPAQPRESGSSRLSSCQAGESSKKRKRTVHWDDAPTIREVPGADRDESLFVSSGLSAQDTAARVASGPAPLTTLQLPGRPRHQESQSPMPKACQLGTRPAQPITWIFVGLPGGADAPSWLRHFESRSHIIFTHTCAAKDFLAQPNLRAEQLCQGPIADSVKAESVANWLRIGGLGLMCHSQDYCVLVFPFRCEEWNVVHAEKSSGWACSMLGYSIFRPTAIFETSMLAPIPNGIPPDGQEVASPMPEPLVYDLFFNFKYDQLLPQAAQKENTHNFFLAFPPSTRQEAYLICQWLRHSDPDCDVRMSLRPGDWSTFTNLGHGTVILHQDAVWTIRLFPDFANLLHSPSGHFSFWIFKRKVLSPSTVPSLDSSPLGRDGELCRTLGPGLAFLVTPSFLVSQPEQAYVFVKWFYQNYNRDSQLYRTSRAGKLVACADIEDWMRDLAIEKSILSSQRAASREDRKREGLTEEATVSRFKTWKLLKNLASESTDEADSPLVYAPHVIDSNDEQSLINWFGWWAIENMDHIRRFSVLGSSDQHPARLSRLVSVPHYYKSTVREPETAFQGIGSSSGQGYDPLQLVPNDEANALAGFLAAVEETIRHQTFRPLILFKFPVAYWHPDMPFHFKDYHSAFNSYSAWFKFFLDEGFLRAPFLNSFAGLFYTIEGEWDRAKYPGDIKPARRPWIAIFRPVNPHRRPWQTSELFIWDYVARDQHAEDSPVYLHDLICGQRELVKYVQVRTKEAFDLPLQRVWLGGLLAGYQRDDWGYSHPLDITLDWLAKLPPSIRDLVPAPEQMIPNRGWKPVLLERPPSRPSSPNPAPTDPIDVDPMDEDLPEDEQSRKKAVFHPPRMDGQRTPSRCVNRLYDWAVGRQRLGVQGKTDFVFEPTMKWYEEQLKAGQGFHHISVMSWKPIFARHKIPDPKGAQDPNATTGEGR